MDELKQELKRLIIKAANLVEEGVAPEDIQDDQPLFVEGLGLDSIDALELSVSLDADYGINISDSETAKIAFASVNSLANFVQANRKK